jgi:aspartyl-tRNA(Asn)/glutamyl-tRNA(Gln) amidotransferase subunit A
MSEDLCYQTIAELSKQLASKKLSPVALTQAYLERAESLDDKLKVVITLTREQALKRAAEMEKEIRAGKVRGPLHGIPYGVKDLFDTKGIKTTWGSIIFKDRVPDRDATCVEKLNNAGSILVAKLTMSEFAGGSTRSNLVPFPHNPWKLDRSTSGSSSGSGASTAAGMVGFSLGTETGGSILGPAASNGTCGMRPTYSRVSRFGCMTLAWSLDKVGPMARSAQDLGVILEAIAGPDSKDVTAGPSPFRFRLEPGRVAGKKIGIVRHEFDLAPAANQAVFNKALDVLKQAGYAFEDVTLPDRPYAEVYNCISNTEGGTFFKSVFNDKRIEGMFDANRRADWMAASMLPASDYLTAQRIRAMITQESDELVMKYTALVAPNSATGAGRIEPAANPNPNPNAGARGGGAARGPAAALTRIGNLAGLPGVGIPCGFDAEGLPLGLQIVSKAWDDQSALDVAMVFQKETDFHRKRPTFKP